MVGDVTIAGMKKSMLFSNIVIDGWESWCAVKDDLPLFAPMLREIFARHGLPYTDAQPMPPATNAVFRVGPYAVKICAPAEVGWPMDDTEAVAMRAALARGIHVPQIFARDTWRDTYDFPYIIMEYITAGDTGEALRAMDAAEKAAFGRDMAEILRRLHVPAREVAALPDNIAEIALTTDSWDPFPASLREDVRRATEALDSNAFVLVHSDLHAENVFIDAQKSIWLLDFGDAHIAPGWYDWPSVVFRLFSLDPIMVRAFFEGIEPDPVLDKLVDGLLLHDFGGDMLHDFCEERNISPQSIRSREDITEVLRCHSKNIWN